MTRSKRTATWALITSLWEIRTLCRPNLLVVIGNEGYYQRVPSCIGNDGHRQCALLAQPEGLDAVAILLKQVVMGRLVCSSLEEKKCAGAGISEESIAGRIRTFIDHPNRLVLQHARLRSTHAVLAKCGIIIFELRL